MIESHRITRNIQCPLEFLPKRSPAVLLLPRFSGFCQVFKQDDAELARVVTFYVGTGKANVALG
jgi:hypothetical protein